MADPKREAEAIGLFIRSKKRTRKRRRHFVAWDGRVSFMTLPKAWRSKERTGRLLRDASRHLTCSTWTVALGT